MSGRYRTSGNDRIIFASGRRDPSILFQEEALRGRWRPRNPITRLRCFEKQAQLDWWCHRAGIAPNVRQRVLAALSFRIAWEGIRLDTYLR